MVYKPDYWRDPDKVEPTDYAVRADPLHATDFEVGRDAFCKFIKEATRFYASWLADHTYKLTPRIRNLEKRWLASGGDNVHWRLILDRAIQESGYAKIMSREASVAASMPIKRVAKPKPKSKFNPLNLTGITIQ